MEPLTNEKWLSRCETWKEMLCADWKVEFQVVPKAEMRRGRLAEAEYSAPRRIALIRLLRVEDYELVPWFPGELENLPFHQERVAVHELNHLRFAALDTLLPEGSVAEAVLEQALHGIDALLVEMVQLARASTATATA